MVSYLPSYHPYAGNLNNYHWFVEAGKTKKGKEKRHTIGQEGGPQVDCFDHVFWVHMQAVLFPDHV